MKHYEAIAPSNFSQVITDLQKAVDKKPKKTDQDKLRQFVEGGEWKIVRGIIERKIESVDTMTKAATREAKTMEELGVRYLIRDQVVAAYKSIIDTVELPKKAQVIRDQIGDSD